MCRAYARSGRSAGPQNDGRCPWSEPCPTRLRTATVTSTNGRHPSRVRRELVYGRRGACAPPPVMNHTMRRLVSRSIRLRRRAHRRIIRLLHPGGFRALPVGVNLIGPAGSSGLAVKTRDYARALESAGIPVTVHLLTDNALASSARRRIGIRRTPKHAFTITLAQPLFFDVNRMPVPLTTGRFVIADWIWEQTELPEKYTRAIEHVDEIWASSEFVRSAYERATTKPITLIPHPVRDPDPALPPMDRRRFGIPDDRFMFLTIAAMSSSMVRKNPLGAMHAFRAAFPHGQTDAVLVIKLLSGDYNPSPEEQRARFAMDPAFGPDIILAIDGLSDTEMTALVRSCDAYVSLHRAEGFGLGAAEAMSMGKAVIVTNWSGSADFLTAENSLPVPYELVTIDEPGMYMYLRGLQWAEPDIRVAAQHMRTLIEDPSLGEALGRRAAQDIERGYSIASTGAMMAARLRELHER